MYRIINNEFKANKQVMCNVKRIIFLFDDYCFMQKIFSEMARSNFKIKIIYLHHVYENFY